MNAATNRPVVLVDTVIIVVIVVHANAMQLGTNPARIQGNEHGDEDESEAS